MLGSATRVVRAHVSAAKSSMDVFSRPPAISEDRLQYALYPPPGRAGRTAAAALGALVLAHVERALGPGFVWHRDAFELRPVPDPDAEGDDYMLEGTMRVGDCVDDEWAVVWLLREVSAQWDVLIRSVISPACRIAGVLNMNSVWDTDGEFLLIEAADVLPSWVTPTNAENRVRALAPAPRRALTARPGLDPRLPSASRPAHTRLPAL
jgi:hypothetical protein